MSSRDEDLKALRERLDRIARELSQLGFPPEPDRPVPQVGSAFGYGEMAFEQWLADVFVPNAGAAIETGRLPPGSQVGVAAMRNFDGQPEKERLAGLLSEFDQAISAYNRAHGPTGTPRSSWWRRLFRR